MFGADVIHVESTVRPDGARLMNHHPRTVPQWWERSPYFHATNTNKRDVTIDMSGAEGRALALRLVAECDVIVENYSPRVMESWGLSWDDIRAVKPDGDHGADAGVRPVGAVARPHRVRHDDGAGVGHGLADRVPRARSRARCSGRATRAPGCTR